MTITHSAKSWYLRQESFPLDDHQIQEWLAGTFPVSWELAQHLAELTHGDAEWWFEKDKRLLASGGTILPAMPIYEVRILEEYGDTYTSARFTSRKDAEACAKAYNMHTEREAAELNYDDRSFASVFRAELWLPAP